MAAGFPLLRLPILALKPCIETMELPQMLSMCLASKRMLNLVRLQSKKCHLSCTFEERGGDPCLSIAPPLPPTNEPIQIDFNARALPVRRSEKITWHYKGKSFQVRYGPNELKLYPGPDYDFWGLINLLKNILQPLASEFAFYSLGTSAHMIRGMAMNLKVIRVTLLGDFEDDIDQYLDFMDHFIGIAALDNRAVSPLTCSKRMDAWRYNYLNIEFCGWMLQEYIASVTNCLSVRFNNVRSFDEDVQEVVRKWMNEVCPLRNFEMVSVRSRPPFTLRAVLHDLDHVMIREFPMRNRQMRRFEPNQCARITRIDGATAVVYIMGHGFYLDQE